MDATALFSHRARQMKASEIRELLKLTEKPNIISFAGGLPNPKTFPTAEIEEAAKRVLRDHPGQALQYSTTEGVQKLREAIAAHLRKDGMDVNPDQVLVTNGSQQGLDLLARVFVDRGDTIVVGNPTYLGALQAFNAYGAQYVAADSDDDGIIPESLERVLQGLKRTGTKPKFLYMVPTFANPSGTTIPEARRRRILELAREHDLLIVEDDPYGKLRFEGDHPPTFFQLDKGAGNVVYLGTFSKILVPGFRLAWAVSPPDINRKLVISKQAVDLCTNAFTQFIAADMLQSGLVDRHLPQIISLYRRKRDLMLSSMEKHFPKENTHWTKTQGGLFTWARMPSNVNCIEMLKDAITKEVAYVPGKSFFPDPDEGFNTMRLNFSHPSDERIEVGVERLGEVMTRWVEKQPVTI
ncbi:MAG TPA: PLP-dependent aminotransferase family protein [Candidatus Thermoplasmatota archaeon]|nr:PLP-dependent aminotransferase family protein [Candidatus Thermoplasmatota archaeon]